ncbi:MAG TPA: hypothetical protein VMM84_02725 [Pyrinomonadaceae bacterium]|nr:hypothetical protein [Pyrinomonadaceae bacterium]
MSPEVLAHLRACDECQLFFEERLKLRQLVAGLGTVEAPPDFNVRLRARLANVTAERRRGIVPINFSLSVPSMVVAALLLLVGLGAGVRLLSGDKEVGPVASNTQPRSDSQSNPAEPSTSGQENGAKPAIGAKQPGPVVVQPAPATVVVKKTIPTEIRPRTAVKDFSNTPAPIFRREDSIASANELPIFPIGADYQSLLVSLDDGSGKPRTISLPSVSFGSQRVLKPELAKTANETKGIW